MIGQELFAEIARYTVPSLIMFIVTAFILELFLRSNRKEREMKLQHELDKVEQAQQSWELRQSERWFFRQLQRC